MLSPYSALRQQLSRYRSPYIKPMTQSEQELLPYVREAQEKAQGKKGLLQPIEALLDLLSRGQYMAANVGQEVVDWARGETPEFGKAVISGATGKIKGDWKDVLFGEQGAIPWEPSTKMGKVGKNVIGFVANVFLDPFTYVGFGPTKGAKAAAKVYVDDMLEIAIKNIGGDPSNLKKIADLNIDTFRNIAAKKGNKAAYDYLEKHIGDVAFQMDLLTKRSTKLGQRFNPEQLAESYRTAVDAIPGGASNDLLAKVGNAAERYAGAGERGLRFMGKEIGVGERYPELIQRWDAMVDSVSLTKPGQALTNAVWAMTGPDTMIGKLKRAFGVKNQYQQLLNAKAVDIREALPVRAARKWDEIQTVIGDLSEEQKLLVRDALIKFQGKPLDNAVIDAMFQGKVPGGAQKVQQLTAVFDDLHRKVKKAQSEGLIPNDWGWIENYLGIKRSSRMRKALKKTRGSAVNPTAKRELGWDVHLEAESQKLQLLGLSRDEARDIIMDPKAGFSAVATDLDEIMARQAMADARLNMLIDMREQFAEFGIKTHEMKGSIATPAGVTSGTTAGLNAGVGGYKPELARTIGESAFNEIQQFGLKTIPGFEGVVFDRDVAEIFDRINSMTSSDPIVAAFGRFVSKWTGMIKGWLTFSPGFHSRNMISNNFTGFMKFGPRWFDPKQAMRSTIAVQVALDGEEKAIKSLAQIGIGEQTVKRILDEDFGGKKLRELINYAHEKGVITTQTMGFNDMLDDVDKFIDTIGQKLGKNLNPFSNENLAFKGSHWVSQRVENIPRFQSFLMDYIDVAEKNPGAALDYAKNQAKKWFIDYGDLSPFEQKYMKKIIPFYCVPDDTEILTREGWKFREEVSAGDEVLTYNVEKDINEWQPIEDIASFDFDDELDHAVGKYADFRYTQDHRFPVEVTKTTVRGKEYGGGRKIIRAYDLNNTHKLILAASTEDQFSDIDEREAAILGWIVTDGYQRKRGNHLEKMIYQSPKKYANEIRELLGDYLSSESIHPDTGVICFRIGRTFPLNIEKEQLPSVVARLSNASALAMWDAMVKAEGADCKGNIQWGQKLGPVMDAFQMLCLILGKPFGYSLRDGGVAYGYVRKTNRLYYKDLKIKTSHYNGVVWCPKTKNSTWYMRQNGKVVASGNTWLRHNISNQVSALWQMREAYVQIPKLEGMIRNKDVDPQDLPGWMRELGYIPVKDEFLPEILQGRGGIWPNMPYQDINRIPVNFKETESGVFVPIIRPWKETAQELLSSAHPTLKWAMEGLTGVDVFYQTPLGEKRKVPLLSNLFGEAPKALQVVDTIMSKVGFDLGWDVDQNGDLVMNAVIAKFLEENTPFLKKAEQFLDLPERIIDIIDKSEEKVTEKDQLKALDQTLNVISFYAGIKLKRLDIEKWRNDAMNEILKEAEGARSEDRKKEPGYQYTSEKYWRDRTAKMRKLGL